MKKLHTIAALALGIVAVACDSVPTDPNNAPGEAALSRSDYSVAGGNVVVATGNIAAPLDAYRAFLGEPLNTTPGPHAGGRREINWDGVPAALTNVDTYPGDFFNSTDPAAPAGRKRGAIFFTAGSGFRVSDNDFADVDPSYGSQFRAFSPAKTFIAVGSNLTDVEFRIPGTDIPALVNGFGVVFSDVDHPRSTRLEFYDSNGRFLGHAWSPARSDDNGHTLVGAAFPSSVVKRVRIVSGRRALGPGVLDGAHGAGHDLVVMDDFLYGEPQPAN